MRRASIRPEESPVDNVVPFLFEEHLQLSEFELLSDNDLATTSVITTSRHKHPRLFIQQTISSSRINIFDVIVEIDQTMLKPSRLVGRIRRHGNFTASQAIINSDGNMVALLIDESYGRVQFFDLEKWQPVKTVRINEQIGFMKWISSNTFAVVPTKRDVIYHIPVDINNTCERRALKRLQLEEGRLTNYCKSISNYLVDESERWNLLAIETKYNRKKILLFRDCRHVATINGQVATFFNMPVVMPDDKQAFLAIAGKQHGDYFAGKGNVSIIQLDNTTMIEETASSPLRFGPPFDSGDFPVGIKFLRRCCRKNWICVVSKFGWFNLFSANTAHLLYMGNASASVNEPISLVKVHDDFTKTRLLCINVTGRVFSLGFSGEDNYSDDTKFNNSYNDEQSSLGDGTNESDENGGNGAEATDLVKALVAAKFASRVSRLSRSTVASRAKGSQGSRTPASNK